MTWSHECVDRNACFIQTPIVPDRMHSYRYTALSDISKKIVGKKDYHSLFDITHYLSSDVGFTNTVVRSTGQSGSKMKYGVPTVRGQRKTSCSVL